MATCDVTQLMEDAKCWFCLRGREVDIAELQLLCDTKAQAEIVNEQIQDEVQQIQDLEGVRFQDDFDDCVGALSAPWHQMIESNYPGCDGGRAVDAGGGAQGAYVEGILIDDVWVQADMGGAFPTGRLYARYPEGDLVFPGGYSVEVTNANTIHLARWDDSPFETSLLDINLPTPFSLGDRLRMEVEGAQIRVYHNHVLVATYDDGSPYSAAGSCGLDIPSGSATWIDNFACGAL